MGRGVSHGAGGKVALVPHQVLGEKPGVVLVSPELLAGQAVASCKDVQDARLPYQNNMSLAKLFYNFCLSHME